MILNYYALNYNSAFITDASLGLSRATDSAARPFQVKIADALLGAVRL